MIKGSVKITFLAACMALLPVLAVDAQTYDSLIRENPDRAAGVLHYYEYSQSPRTKAPKGFKPFYISHYMVRATTQAPGTWPKGWKG